MIGTPLSSALNLEMPAPLVGATPTPLQVSNQARHVVVRVDSLRQNNGEEPDVWTNNCVRVPQRTRRRMRIRRGGHQEKGSCQSARADPPQSGVSYCCRQDIIKAVLNAKGLGMDGVWNNIQAFVGATMRVPADYPSLADALMDRSPEAIGLIPDVEVLGRQLFVPWKPNRSGERNGLEFFSGRTVRAAPKACIVAGHVWNRSSDGASVVFEGISFRGLPMNPLVLRGSITFRRCEFQNVQLVLDSCGQDFFTTCVFDRCNVESTSCLRDAVCIDAFARTTLRMAKTKVVNKMGASVRVHSEADTHIDLTCSFSPTPLKRVPPGREIPIPGMELLTV